VVGGEGSFALFSRFYIRHGGIQTVSDAVLVTKSNPMSNVRKFSIFATLGTAMKIPQRCNI
jgi:hypothetical protein